MNIRDEMAILYGKKCMLTLVRDLLTFHHIVKEEHGGPKTIDNGALITQIAHSWLHNIIEMNDKGLYVLINEGLVLYKQAIEQQDSYTVQMYREEVVPEYKECIISKYKNEPKKIKLLRR